jgi:glucose 1-dehydrogenase
METSKLNRKALVTGASRGIGRGIALALAEEGYDLAISYCTGKEEAEELAQIVEGELGRVCREFSADLAKEETPARLVAQAAAALGGLDLLVNNAGLTMFDHELGDDVGLIDRLIQVDFRAYLLASNAAARHMIAAGTGGGIVNITSSRAERAYPQDAVYGGMKAAVRRATESLAIRYAPHRIRVNCIAPGAIAVSKHPHTVAFYESLSRKVPLGRIGTPRDIGNAVAWIASEKASYITGITLRIDGGLILPGMPELRLSDPDRGWGDTEEDFLLQGKGRG